MTAPASFSPIPNQQPNFPCLQDDLAQGIEVSAGADGGCRESSTELLRRRLHYIARFVLWTVRHRSTRHVRWVLAFEGTPW